MTKPFSTEKLHWNLCGSTEKPHQPFTLFVDIDIYFNSAAILKGKTVEHVWDAFLTCWTTLYTGFPQKI